jgi:uncharacterized repeat protein (TIGR03803 family)
MCGSGLTVEHNVKSRIPFVVFIALISLFLTACGRNTAGTPPPTTFTIGGTVSGFSGTGLVLQNNGGDNLTINQNGSFTFSSPVGSGQSYRITVLTQPAAQDCTVANGSGSANSNIVNVQVSCVTLYTVGGTVTGLSGAGLVLLDNGSDGLSIAANGSFTFATRIASGGSYNVTIFSQPPNQNCAVINGSGTAIANVTNVQVTCANIVTYTIGGVVSGYPGTPFSIEDNGTDILPISANGPFTFPTPVQSGNSYNVTVFSSPTNYTCTVTNGSGIALANVTNVQVTCAPNEQILYTFGTAPDGAQPKAAPVFDGAGNLYGTTSQGGSSGGGTVYKLSKANGKWTETIIYNFCPQVVHCPDGAAPYSDLIFDAAGNLYGTTLDGGAYALGGGAGGVVFELSPQPNGSWTESVLHSFGNGTDGILPLGGLIFDSSGNLYGTTTGGGTSTSPSCFGGCGTVFELSPQPGGQWTESVLYNFCSQVGCADGNDPAGALVFDAAGNLYGTTAYGGSSSLTASGTIFQLAPAGGGQWTQTVLHVFQDDGSGRDGYQPNGSLIIDQSGVLYGTTPFGGQYGNNGSVFRAQQDQQGQWADVVYSFGPPIGSSPYGGLVADKSGTLYGTTSFSGAFNAGTVFQLAPNFNGTGYEVTLYNFMGGLNDGYGPQSSLIMDSAGNLYGASFGGANNNGVIFEVTHNQ